jgi:Lar family restriction alleviation protein
MSEKIKPCPFCGYNASEYSKKSKGITWYRIACKGCRATTDLYNNKENAYEAWNMRESEVVHDKLNEVLDSFRRSMINEFIGQGIEEARVKKAKNNPKVYIYRSDESEGEE